MFKRYAVYRCLTLSFLLPLLGGAQRVADPTAPAAPSISTFSNVAMRLTGDIFSNNYIGSRVIDGTGSVEYDPNKTAPGTGNVYVEMQGATLLVATHIFSDNTNPFRHTFSANTVTQQQWETGGNIANSPWMFLFGRNDQFPNAPFVERSIINFKSYTIDQTVGAGVAKPVGLSNVVVTIDGTMTFTNGKMYSIQQAASNLNVEEVVLLSGSTTSGGSAASYLDGPMRKIGAASSFRYVLGDQSIYSPLTYTGSNPGANGTVVRYFAGGGSNTSSLSPNLASVSPEEHYAINSTDNNATLTIPITNFPGYTGANWTIAGFNGTQWVNLKPEGSGAGTINGNEVTVTGANLNGITMIAPALATTFNVLPVDFLTFTAAPAGTKAQLIWTIANAVNVSHFVVERSCDGQAYTAIGNVAFSAQEDRYAFTDAQPCASISYYRVKNVDFDGKFKYTPVRTVRFGSATSPLVVWPNPTATQKLSAKLPQSFSGSSSVQWVLVNAKGQQAKAGSSGIASDILTINIAGLASGSYTIILQNAAGERLTAPFVKQ